MALSSPGLDLQILHPLPALQALQGNGILMEDTGTAYRDNFALQIPAGATA